jgi:hypothetical protein
MRWPEARKLIDRIRRERPELTVDSYASPGTTEHYCLRISALRRGPADGSVLPFHLIPGSIDTIFGAKGWEEFKRRHPEPFCRPEESYHSDAMGREVDHRGRPVRAEPPPAPAITAEEMLACIITLNRRDPGWWERPEAVAEMAQAWGVRTRGWAMADYEAEEVARVSGDCHASVLIARTGSGLFAYGVAARWGDGGTGYEPTVLSVPFDTASDARRAAMNELAASLQVRGAGHQKRLLLLEAVREADRQRGLFG